MCVCVCVILLHIFASFAMASIMAIMAMAMIIATTTRGRRHWSIRIIDQGFKIGMDLVTRRRRIHPVHKVAHISLVPWIFIVSTAAPNIDGIQILVPSNIHVLVGRQIHHDGQLGVI